MPSQNPYSIQYPSFPICTAKDHLHMSIFRLCEMLHTLTKVSSMIKLTLPPGKFRLAALAFTASHLSFSGSNVSAGADFDFANNIATNKQGQSYRASRKM